MDTFTYCLPTHLEEGDGAIAEAGRLVAHYGGTKVLVLFGDTSVLLSGLIKRIINSLDRALLDHVVLGGFKAGEQMEMVNEGIPFARDERADFVLAVGGGEVIDAAKAIAAGALYMGEPDDLIEGRYEPMEALPLGCLLTQAPTGAEASPDAFISKGEKALHMRSIALTPAFAIVDNKAIEALERFPLKDDKNKRSATEPSKWSELAYTAG